MWPLFEIYILQKSTLLSSHANFLAILINYADYYFKDKMTLAIIKFLFKNKVLANPVGLEPTTPCLEGVPNL